MADNAYTHRFTQKMLISFCTLLCCIPFLFMNFVKKISLVNVNATEFLECFVVCEVV
jgi:hypothetical protein